MAAMKPLKDAVEIDCDRGGAGADIKPFGTCPAGPVSLVTIRDGAGVAVELLTLGAAVRSVVVPDRGGRPTDVCLGYDTAEEYWENDAYLGACVGRCANRVAGARITLGGTDWPLTPNEGENQLHGGRLGFDKKLWSCSAGARRAVFSTVSPHLEEGYPGSLRVEVSYSLEQPGLLEITYRAQSDRDTVVNLTNHAYWNLAGQDGGRVEGHRLWVRAGRYTPCGPGNIPTGEILPVDGTPLDLREPVPLGERLSHPALAGTRGFDHNLVLESPGQGPSARLWCPDTGVAMEVETTMPGMQVYTAGFLAPRRGKAGASYGPGHGVCLETQFFPDAVHHPNFPSPVLRAGEAYFQRTSFRFFLRE